MIKTCYEPNKRSDGLRMHNILRGNAGAVEERKLLAAIRKAVKAQMEVEK